MKLLSPTYLIILISIFSLQACSVASKLGGIFPDKGKDYQKSETLPDLEIPPDLTTEAINDNMAIPNERSATLSRYRNAPVAGRGIETRSGITEDDEQWLAVRGNTQQLWPGLREHFISNGYTMELDDAELGVLVTGWSSPSQVGGFSQRNKFKIFSEPGADQISTVLFISNETQQRIGDAGSETWVDVERDRNAEKQLVVELNNKFNTSTATAATRSNTGANADAAPQQEQKERPQMLDIGDGKLYLAIADEFSRAWLQTGVVIQGAGLKVTGADQTKGIYTIDYFDSTEKNKGFISKLKLWKDAEPEAIKYQLSLTGVGNKTELIILNEDGDWDTSDNAKRIMTLIQERYNAS